MANVNMLPELKKEIVELLNTAVKRAREFARPEEGETYSIFNIVDVELPNREKPYKALQAKTSAGIDVTFWPSWLYQDITDKDGIRHISTVNGQPVNNVDENFPDTLKCQEIETFTAIRNVYDGGKVVDTAEKTCYVYHWVSAER